MYVRTLDGDLVNIGVAERIALHPAIVMAETPASVRAVFPGGADVIFEGSADECARVLDRIHSGIRFGRSVIDLRPLDPEDRATSPLATSDGGRRGD